MEQTKLQCFRQEFVLDKTSSQLKQKFYFERLIKKLISNNDLLEAHKFR